MTDSIEKKLIKGIHLLKILSENEYSDSSIGPYYSSIGCHIRHVLDIYSCIFKGLENNFIDFSVRERNESVEKETLAGIEYFEIVIEQLKKIKKEDFQTIVKVSDDMGFGNETASSTIAAVLMQAQSHTLHHYATIGYLIYQLGIELPDAMFGYNPTTPKKIGD